MISNPAPGSSSEAAVTAAAPENFRALQWDEVVRRGDFVAAGRAGFQPWEGPGGFRADAFVKTIYRKQAGQPAGAGKSP